MRKILLIILLLTSLISYGQNDSSQTYITFSPCFTNEIGSIKTKFSPTIEIGKQFDDVLTTGFAIGKTNCANHTLDDIYLEFRPNLNVFQVGRFTNTLTTGIGYVFNPNTSLMLEITTGIEFAYSDRLHFNVFFGNYYYSGFTNNPNNGSYTLATNGNTGTASPTPTTEHYSPTFFGFSVMWFFKPTKIKGLLKVK